MRANSYFIKSAVAMMLVGGFLVGNAMAQVPDRMDFSALDAQVRALGKPSSPAKLVAQLAEITSNDWEKARAIYVWLTENIAYDADGYFGKRAMVWGMNQVYSRGMSVCQGYADLFTYLANGLGMPCETISGYAKGYSYAIGQKFTQTDHAWNKLAINGYWYLFDATWGAGAMEGKSFVKDFSEAWFAMDPWLFILNHFPEKTTDTLIPDNYSLKDYQTWVFIEPYVLSRLLSLGFYLADIVNTAIAGQLPMVYGILDARVTHCTMPLVLTMNTMTHFEISGTNITDVALIQNGYWFYFWNTANGFYLDMAPNWNKVTIVVHIAGRDTTYAGFMDLWVR